MARQTIDTAGTGDTLPSAFGKINTMTAELYRPLGVPTLVTPLLPTPICWFEDFVAPNMGHVQGAVGTIATPDTLTHLTNVGGPNWGVTFTNGVGGAIAGGAGGPNLDAVGVCTLSNASVTNGQAQCDLVSNSIHNGVLTFGATKDAIGQVRFKFSGIASGSCRGVGWAAAGPDPLWIQDPDDPFHTRPENAIVVTRHAPAYSGAAGGAAETAGDVMYRIYNVATGLVAKGVLVPAASFSNTAWYKFEVHWDASESDLLLYLNDALVATVDGSAIASVIGTYGYVLTPTFGCATSVGGSAGKQIEVDSYYHEQTITPR